jgi:hypothetical protein
MPDSRAVTMPLLPNEDACCATCGVSIGYNPKGRTRWVLANVYVDVADGGRKWDRVERWHVRCYKDAGEPYGEALYRKPVITKKKTS